MFGDLHFAFFGTVKSIFIEIIAPLEYTVSWPITSLEELVRNMASKKDLLDENTKLHIQNVLLQAKVQKLVALEQENAELRGLVSAITPTKERFLIAELLAVSTNSVSQEIVLDKGKKDDVYVGQPVLDAHGIMGQVILVSTNTSVVLLVTDAESAIPVQVARNGVRAIAIGAGDGGTLELTGLSETADVKAGDLLVTSGLGSRFPEGYPLGVVVRSERIPGERFLSVIVAPSAHVNQNRQVLLVWPHLVLQQDAREEEKQASLAKPIYTISKNKNKKKLHNHKKINTQIPKTLEVLP